MTGLGAMMAGGNPDEERGRQKDDYYATPLEVTQALMRHLRDHHMEPLGSPSGIWEPCAGDMKMVIPIAVWLHKHLPHPILSTDINPRHKAVKQLDFFDAKRMPAGYDTIISNPPFNLAEKLIRHAFAIGCQRMALVLKSTFWHAAGRTPLFEQHRPSAIMPLTWRPDFLGLGRPTMECSWVVWSSPCSDEQPHYILLSNE